MAKQNALLQQQTKVDKAKSHHEATKKQLAELLSTLES